MHAHTHTNTRTQCRSCTNVVTTEKYTYRAGAALSCSSSSSGNGGPHDGACTRHLQKQKIDRKTMEHTHDTNGPHLYTYRCMISSQSTFTINVKDVCCYILVTLNDIIECSYATVSEEVRKPTENRFLEIGKKKKKNSTNAVMPCRCFGCIINRTRNHNNRREL